MGGADTYGIAVRVGLFALLEVLGLMIFGSLLAPWAGVMATATMATFLAAFITNTFTVRIFERLSIADLGLNWNQSSLLNLFWGLAGGVVSALVVLVPPILLGIARLVPAPEQPANLSSLIFVSTLLALGVVGEELLFRGYGFQLLLKHTSPFATILPVSVLFAAAHTLATPIGLFNTFLWGAIFGFAVLRSGDLWLAIGLHLGWNWTLPLFGANLSGMRMSVTGYTLEWSVGTIWSGGEYGPEASLITTAVIPLLAVALWQVPIATQELKLVTNPNREEEDPK